MTPDLFTAAAEQAAFTSGRSKLQEYTEIRFPGATEAPQGGLFVPQEGDE